MKKMLAFDAWMAALHENGPSEVAAICERAYATGVDIIDLDSVRQAVADGLGAEILSALPTVSSDAIDRLQQATERLIQALR